MKFKISRIGLSLFIICIMFGSIQAQQTDRKMYPVIGDTIPEYCFSEIHYYGSDKNVCLSDFKGKPLVIDFFSLGCVSCFKSFPEINKLKTEFGDKIEIILVAPSNPKYYDLTKKTYEAYAKKYNLKLSVVYDSGLFNQFRIQAVPKVIYIDENQIVKAVTNSVSYNALNALLNHKAIEFTDYSVDYRESLRNSYDSRKPFMINGNGANNSVIIQRSLLTKWEKGIPHAASYAEIDHFDSIADSKYPFQLLGYPLKNLYFMAYYGNLYGSSSGSHGDVYSDIIFETALGTPKQFNKSNKFCYSLILPDSVSINSKHVMPIMQRDLKNFFGYEVIVEERSMPYLKLVASEKAKELLRTKGGTAAITGSYSGFVFVNKPISSLVNLINSNNSLSYNKSPIVDETGIEFNIDFTLDAISTDLEDVKKCLNKNGLDLIESKRRMKVLVIRDPKSESVE